MAAGFGISSSINVKLQQLLTQLQEHHLALQYGRHTRTNKGMWEGGLEGARNGISVELDSVNRVKCIAQTT